MKLSQIRHLIDVAERGSLQSSAEKLGVSTAALLRSIRGLERELGTALFDRGRKSMTLTPVGKVFVRRASTAQRELDRASDGLGPLPAPSGGIVAIGVSASPLVALLPKILMRFQMLFPQVRLRIVEGGISNAEQAVCDGSLDFYVGPIVPHLCMGDLQTEKLYDVERIVLGRRGHPLASAVSLAELAGASWIATTRSELDALFDEYGLAEPMVVIEAGTGLSQLSVAAGSDALLLVSGSWIGWITRMDELAIFPHILRLPPEAVYIATLARLPLTPAAACLHALFVQQASSICTVAALAE